MKLSELLRGRWIKHAQPVLSLGPSGEWDDLMVDCPSIFLEESGKLFLFYTGHSSRRHDWAIGIAESDDLFHWKKYGGNPVLSSGVPGSWDQRIDGPALFGLDNKFYLFYEATGVFSLSKSPVAYMIPHALRKGLGSFKRWVISKKRVVNSQVVEHAKGRCIGFAVSDDLMYWRKNPGNPVLTPSRHGKWDSQGVFSPCIFKNGSLFYLFYGGSDGKSISSGMALSSDLCQWKKMDGPLLTPGPEGSWDGGSALVVSVIKLEDSYVAFYEGQDAYNQYAIGFAYSPDLKRWNKYVNNPILTTGPKGSLDERMVNSPHVFLKDEKLYIFYGSQDFKMRGYSTIAHLSTP